MTTVNTLLRASFMFAGALIAAAALGGLLTWSALHTDEMLRAADAYEACVAGQYGTTPAAFYQEHRTYPECVTR